MSACSCTLLITSSYRLLAYEDKQSKERNFLKYLKKIKGQLKKTPNVLLK